MQLHKLFLTLGAFAFFALLTLAATAYADSTLTKSSDSVQARYATPTIGPTVAACPDKPNKPWLVAPANGSAFKSRNATLDWSTMYCAASFYVTVKKDTVFGPIVDEAGVYPSVYTTKNLQAGHTYIWHVSAC